MNILDESNEIRNLYASIKFKSPATYNNFAILRISVLDTELMDEYTTHVNNHNEKLMSEKYPNSGFDILFPERKYFNSTLLTKFVDFNIKLEMLYCDVSKDVVYNTAFNLHPRSSISKTPLMLANHTGIVDSGYRGSIIGAFRNLDTEDGFDVCKYSRLLQICHPSLCPIYVVIVNAEELSRTERDAGAFGSTGK